TTAEQEIFAAAELLRRRITGEITQAEYEELSRPKKHCGRGEPLPSAAELRAQIAGREQAASVAPPIAEPRPEPKKPEAPNCSASIYSGSTVSYDPIEKETEQQLLDRLMRWAGYAGAGNRSLL